MNVIAFSRAAARRFAVWTPLFAAATLAGCAKPAVAPPKPPPVAVAVATVTAHDVPVYLGAEGRITAFQSVNIVSQVEGQIIEMPFTQGSFVKTGDKLAVIFPAPFEAAVKKAAGQVVTDQANLELANAQVKRSAQLLTDQYISQQQYDTYVAQVAGLKGQLQVDQALLDTANISLSYTNITAPVDGMVGTYMINRGNVVKVNDQPITTIQTMSPIYADFVVSETDFPNLRQHFDANGGKLKATIVSESAAKTQEDGELSILGNAIGTSTGTLSLRAVLPNDKHEFWPNQPVIVRILLETLPNAVLVPEGAIMLSQQGPFVFVVLPSKSPDVMPTVDKRVVQTGQTQDDGTKVITSGLTPGEQVVVQGAQMMLMPGSSVYLAEIDGKAVAPPPGAPAAPGSTSASTAAPASTVPATTAPAGNH